MNVCPKQLIAACCGLFMAVLSGCALVTPTLETAREKLFAAEQTYQAVVNTAAAAIEAGQLSRDDAEIIDIGRQLVRDALDSATLLVKSGDGVDAIVFINEAAVLLAEMAVTLGARHNE